MTSFSPLPPEASQNISNHQHTYTVTLPTVPSEVVNDKGREGVDTIDLAMTPAAPVTATPEAPVTVDKAVDRAVIRRLESALAEPDKTRVRLLDRITLDELQPKAIKYTLSILTPIPARELLSKDPHYQYAVNFALTYGSYVAPLWPHVTGKDVQSAETTDICTALSFILETVERRAPSEKARDARILSVLEKVLLNTDSLFREALIDLERELLTAQLTNEVGIRQFDSKEINDALEQTLCFLPVTASQRYRFHLGLTGD